MDLNSSRRYNEEYQHVRIYAAMISMTLSSAVDAPTFTCITIFRLYIWLPISVDCNVYTSTSRALLAFRSSYSRNMPREPCGSARFISSRLFGERLEPCHSERTALQIPDTRRASAVHNIAMVPASCRDSCVPRLRRNLHNPTHRGWRALDQPRADRRLRANGPERNAGDALQTGLDELQALRKFSRAP